MTLMASALVEGDCIDAAAALRGGRTARVLGCEGKAPSTHAISQERPSSAFLFRVYPWVQLHHA